MIPEIAYNSWDDFKTLFRERLGDAKAHPERNFVFRGHRDASWKLMPSLMRSFRVKSEELVAIKESLLKAFCKNLQIAGENVSGVDNLDDVKADETLRVWAKGQHYGLPTPLLDWSESPYVAARFAYQDAFDQILSEGWAANSRDLEALRKQRLAIFALRMDTDRRGPNKRLNDAGVKIIRHLGEAGNKRIRNQLGLFTMLPDGIQSLEESVAKIDGEPLLFKFTLPFGTAYDAILDLESMDVTPRRLYSDWGGICKSALIEAQLQKLRGP